MWSEETEDQLISMCQEILTLYEALTQAHRCMPMTVPKYTMHTLICLHFFRLSGLAVTLIVQLTHYCPILLWQTTSSCNSINCMS